MNRILILDDDPEFAEVVKECISDFCVVVLVYSIDEAIDALAQSDYDLCICDKNLPDGTGNDVCRFAKEQRETMPVIILSGEGSVDEKIFSFSQGANEYLVKPLDLRELRLRVKYHLQKRI